MRVGVYLNSKYYSHNESFVERIFKAFEEQNCISVKSFDDLDGLDVLFVLGGDGTIPVSYTHLTLPTIGG